VGTCILPQAVALWGKTYLDVLVVDILNVICRWAAHGNVSNKCIAVRKVATPLQELTCRI